MKKPVAVSLFMWALALPSLAEYEIPSEIVAGITHSVIGETGGFGIYGVEEDTFRESIRKNWRDVANHIDNFPAAIPRGGFIYTSEAKAITTSIANFCIACESLPPEEYVEFLERWMDLWDQGKIPYSAIESTFGGRDSKYSFLAVNWEHGRIQAILAKAKRLTPTEDTNMHGYIDSLANGELADHYMQGMPDDMPLPETLPGIKLQRPYFSLIKKFERLTGKKFRPIPVSRRVPPPALRSPFPRSRLPLRPVLPRPWVYGSAFSQSCCHCSTLW